MNTVQKILIWGSLSLFFPLTAAAQIGPANLNISGTLFNADGSLVSSANVNFQIQVLDKNAVCVLYSEKQSAIDLSESKGAFSFLLGSGTAQVNSLEGSSSYDGKIFYNSGAVAAFAGCPSGLTFSAGDSRIIRLSYDLGSGFVTLTPDIPISNAPYAMVADSLQGKAPTDFLQVMSDANHELTQSNLQFIFNSTNYPILQSLIAGTSAAYISSTPGSTVDLNGQRLTNLNAPIASSDAVTKGYADGDLGGQTLNLSGIGLGVGGGKTLVWDQTAGQWVVQNAGSVTYLASGVGLVGGPIVTSGTLAVDVGTSANQIVQLNGLAQIPVLDGSLLTNVNATKLLSRSIASTVPTSGQVLTYNAVSSQWEPRAAVGLTSLGGDVVAVGPGTATATIQANAVNASAKINSSGVAVNRLVITDAVTGATLEYGTCSTNQVYQWTASGWACTDISTLLGASGVTAGTYGDSAQVAQLTVNAQGQVTALSNLNIAFPVTSVAGHVGAVTLNATDISGLGTAALQNYGSLAGNLVQLNGIAQYPANDGSLITNINASSLRGLTISAVLPTAGQVLTYNGLLESWDAEAATAASNGFINGGNSFGSTATLGTNDNNSLSFQVSNLVAMTILTNGYVGIGTTSPAQALEVNGGNIQIDNGGVYAVDNIGYYGINGSGGLSIWNYGLSPINFGVNGAEKVRIDINGNVGIGTTSPTAALQLKAGTAMAGTAPLKLTAGINLTTPEAGAIEFDGTNLYYTTAAGTRQTLTTGAGNLSGVNSISDSSGNITLAAQISTGAVIVNSGTPSTTSASGALQVSGGVGVSGSLNAGSTLSAGTSLTTPQIYGSSSASGNIKIDGTSNAAVGNVLLVPAGGNVGIGTTSPGAMLEVDAANASSIPAIFKAANSQTANLLQFEGSTGTIVALVTPTGRLAAASGNSSAPGLTFVSDQTTGLYSPATGALGLNTNGLERVRIDSSGNVGVGTTSPSTSFEVQGVGATASTEYLLGKFDSMSASKGVGLGYYENASGTGVQEGRVRTIASVPLALGTSNSPQAIYVLDLTGSVGIGTTSPAVRLEVNTGNNAAPASSGTASNANLRLSSTSTGEVLELGVMGGSNPLGAWLQSTVSTNLSSTNSLLLNPNGGNVGIGTTSPLVKLDVAGPIYSENTVANGLLLNSASVNYGTIANSAANTWSLGYGTAPVSLGTQVLTWNSSGNVGIGTTGPGALLEMAASGSNNASLIQTAVGSGSAYITQRYAETGPAIVGSGDFLGSYNIAGYDGSAYRFASIIRTEVDGTPGSGSMPGRMEFFTTPSGSSTPLERLRITNAGNIGVGTSSPAYKLDIYGASGATIAHFSDGSQTCSITPSSAGNISCSSDEKLKTDIIPVSNRMALEKILQMKTVTFHWKKGDRQTHTGYIAQNVEKVAPEFVLTGEDGFKQVSYVGFIPWITSAIRELYDEFIPLRERITQLNKENADLRQMIKQQNARLEALEKKID